MGHVHVDAADLLIAWNDDPDLLERLQKVKGVRATLTHETGNAQRYAARSRSKPNLALQHFVIVLFHVLLHPGLQVRIAEISDPKRRLPADAVGNEGMRRILGDGRQTALNRLEE